MRLERWSTALVTSLAILTVACEDPVHPAPPATYRIEVSGELFIVKVADDAVAARFDARLAEGGTGVINGRLIEGDGGFNQPWSWHLDPEDVDVADIAIELCDGRPSLIEADLDYWFGSVKRFCPWGARIVSRED